MMSSLCNAWRTRVKIRSYINKSLTDEEIMVIRSQHYHQCPVHILEEALRVDHLAYN